MGFSLVSWCRGCAVGSLPPRWGFESRWRPRGGRSENTKKALAKAQNSATPPKAGHCKYLGRRSVTQLAVSRFTSCSGASTNENADVLVSRLSGGPRFCSSTAFANRLLVDFGLGELRHRRRDRATQCFPPREFPVGGSPSSYIKFVVTGIYAIRHSPRASCRRPEMRRVAPLVLPLCHSGAPARRELRS